MSEEPAVPEERSMHWWWLVLVLIFLVALGWAFQQRRVLRADRTAGLPADKPNLSDGEASLPPSRTDEDAAAAPADFGDIDREEWKVKSERWRVKTGKWDLKRGAWQETTGANAKKAGQ